MTPFRFCGFSSLFTLSVPDGGYSGGASCALVGMAMFLF